MDVPFFDATREPPALAASLRERLEEVLASGRYILGPTVEEFERRVCAYVGSGHAVGVGNGTDALWLALRALGVCPGDRVLTSPLTFFATVSAIRNVGAQPVFADVDRGTFNVDSTAARAVLDGTCPVDARRGGEPGTVRAIVPVHLYGQPAAMGPLLELGLEFGVPVVEDAAQAFGARFDTDRAGTMGHLGCYSFFPTKNLGGMGDGGMVVTDDATLAERVRMLRGHGSRRQYEHELIGTNSRLDALQAAFLSAKLDHVEGWTARRRTIAGRYREALAGFGEVVRAPVERPPAFHTFNQYTVRVGNGMRDGLQAHLASRGVQTAIYYPSPAHLQPALEECGFRTGDYPEAERAATEVLSLPVFPGVTDEEQDWVIESLAGFF